MAQSKFCKDCVHARPAAWLLFSTQERWRYAQCAVSDKRGVIGDDLVHPEARKPELAYCSTERDPTFDMPTQCGPEGRFFEAKK